MLTDLQMAGLFKLLGEKRIEDVGFEYELDKKYKTVNAMKSAVYRMFTKVKNNPEAYGVSKETYDDVLEKMDARRQVVIKQPEQITVREQQELINPQDIKGLVLGGRNKAAKLLYTKLDRLDKSKKLLDGVRLGELATVMAILVDKGQILQGQSTENIAVISKIDSNLSAEDALELVLRTRDATQEEKAK